MSFKDNLRYEISFLDLSLKDFAKKINVNYDTILSYIDSREVRPSAENAVKIAKGINVTVEYLMTGEKTIIDDYLKNRDFFESLKMLPDDISKEIKKIVLLLSKKY